MKVGPASNELMTVWVFWCCAASNECNYQCVGSCLLFIYLYYLYCILLVTSCAWIIVLVMQWYIFVIFISFVLIFLCRESWPSWTWYLVVWQCALHDKRLYLYFYAGSRGRVGRDIWEYDSAHYTTNVWSIRNSASEGHDQTTGTQRTVWTGTSYQFFWYMVWLLVDDLTKVSWNCGH